MTTYAKEKKSHFALVLVLVLVLVLGLVFAKAESLA